MAGGVGFLMGPWASAAFGGGLRGSFIAGALEGSLTDGAMQITINWASGRSWHHHLGWTLLGGGLAGGVGGGIGWLTPRTVHLIGFQGVGIKAENYVRFYGEWGARVLPNEHGLIKAGHFGLSLNRGRTIYGFFPGKNAMARINQTLAEEPFFYKNANLRNMSDYLDNRLPVQGQWRDDTGIFQHAHQLAKPTGGRTTLLHTTFRVSNPEYYRIKSTLKKWVTAGETMPMFYRFPYPDKPMPACYNNCLTAPRMLNLDFVLDPNQTGMVSQARPNLDTFKTPWFWSQKELPQ